jgi:hypothetical protein
MRRASTIVHEFSDAGAMSDLVNLFAFVDDAVFMTKSGDLGVVLALDGADYECLDAEQRDTVTRRFEVALRMWDEHTRLYQYVLKRRAEPSMSQTTTGASVDELLRRRVAYFESKCDDLYAVSLYLVILQEGANDPAAWMSRLRRTFGAPLTSIGDALSAQRTIVRLDADIDRGRLRLRQKAAAFCEQLQDSVRPRVLRKAEAFSFFRCLLNYDIHKAHAIPCHHDTFLDFDLCDSALECHRSHLRLDDYHVRVLTLKEPPSHTFAHLLQALYEIPSNLILVNEWQREGQGAVRREIHAKRRHFHNAKVSLTNYVTDGPTAHQDLLVDDSAAAIVHDLGACLTELTLQGRYFGQYSMTIVLYDRDPMALERTVSSCIKALGTHDAQVTDERYNLLNAWLAILPGNGASNVRRMHLLNTNYADLSMVFAQDGGAERNAHLGRESLAWLETTHQTLYHLNLHVDDVGHTVVLSCSLLALATVRTLAQAPDRPMTSRVARTIVYHPRDLVTIRAKLHYTTLIVLPDGEDVLEATCGDKEFWIVNVRDGLVSVKPANGTHIDLDHFHGLNQVGDLGLQDQVDRHYAQIFGVSLAIGAIAGLAQIHTNVGLDATSMDAYRQGVATNIAQSSARVLDRFLNLLPTVTIREGHRIKVYLSNDLELPAYTDAIVTTGGRP